MGNTKRKIADGLQEMLHVKPLRKITVQDIMDCKDMKRQSFYYHFQDIYGVIEWIFHEDFVKQVAYDEDEAFEDWIRKVVRIIKENRFFYRKVQENISRERLMERLNFRTQSALKRICFGEKVSVIRLRVSKNCARTISYPCKSQEPDWLSDLLAECCAGGFPILREARR